jgi:radical SAM-linked protein
MTVRQRLRLTFGRGPSIKYITHLDLMRAWERLLRRSRLPVAYTGPNKTRPRIALAAPLAVGVTSSGELAEIFLVERLPVGQVILRLNEVAPPGLTISGGREIGLGLPSLQSLVRAAEYRVTVEAHMPEDAIRDAMARVLAASSLPRERHREDEVRHYDLRPLIQDIWLEAWGPDLGVLGMRLRTDEQATGRADEVLAELGLLPATREIHRTKLIVATPPLSRSPRRTRP